MSKVLGEELKKVLLAGIGAVAISAEKSKEIVDDLIKKGEVTVEQGKVLNEELKRKFKEKMNSKEEESEDKVSEILNTIDSLSPEEIEKIKEKLQDNKEVEE